MMTKTIETTEPTETNATARENATPPSRPGSRFLGLPFLIAAWAPFFIFSLIHRMPLGPTPGDAQAAHAAKAWSAGAMTLADAAGRVGSPGGVVILNAITQATGFPSRAPLFLAAAAEVLFLFALLALGRAMGSALWGWAVAAVGLYAAQLVNTTATSQFQFALGGALAALFALGVIRATASGGDRKRGLLAPGIIAGALGLLIAPVSGAVGLALALPSLIKQRNAESPDSAGIAHGGRIAFGLIQALASLAVCFLFVKNPSTDSALRFLNNVDFGVGAIHMTAALGVGILTAPLGVWTAVLAAAALLPFKTGLITIIALAYILIFGRDASARFCAALCMGVAGLLVSGLAVQCGPFMRFGVQALFWSGALHLLTRSGLAQLAGSSTAATAPHARGVAWGLFGTFAVLSAYWTFDAAAKDRQSNQPKAQYVTDILKTLDWVAGENTASAPITLLNAPGGSQGQIDLIAQIYALRSEDGKQPGRIRSLRAAPAPGYVITNQEGPKFKEAFDAAVKGIVHQEGSSKLSAGRIEAKPKPAMEAKAQTKATKPAAAPAKPVKPAPVVIHPGNIAIKGGTPGPKADAVTYRALFTNGIITYPVNVPVGRVAFEIQAWGTSYEGIGPRFEISIGDLKKTVLEAKSSKPQIYHFQHEFKKAGVANLRIRYVNDNQGKDATGKAKDRNLFIGRVVAKPLP